MNKHNGLAIVLSILVSIWSCNTVLSAKTNLDIVLINEKNKTSYDYKVFKSEKEYEKSLKKQMARVYDTLQGHIQKDNIYPIPGIIRTVYEKDGKNKKSTNYTPQGICKANDYILVTSYYDAPKDDKKKLSGVVYVIDAKSHEYIATLSIPQSYHNGGIACDGENIWFCGNTSNEYVNSGKSPFVQYMKYARLKEIVENLEANNKDSATVSKKDFSEEIYISNKPSFLECDKGVLWVGTYINNKPESNEGFAIGYPILNKESDTVRLDILDVYRINGLPSSQQGMDIEGNTLYISSSGFGGENWIQSSFVSTFDISSLKKSRISNQNGKFIKQIEVPKMNEEILVDQKSVYLVFESCADSFLKSKPNGMKTDRILPLERSLWE